MKRFLVAFVAALTLTAGSAQAAQVKLGSRLCKQFARIYSAVTVNPGTGVSTMDFTYTYDPAFLSVRGVYRTALTTQYALTSDLSTPGVITMHLSGTTPLSANGEVAGVLFDAIGATGTSSPLVWTLSSLNDGAIASQTANGSVGIVPPQTVISAPHAVVGDPGANVAVLISATAFTGGDSFDIDLAFDPGVITATSVERTALTGPLSLTYNTSVPGIVRIALYGVSAVNGPGDLVRVWFHVTGPLGSETPIDIARGNINEGVVPTTLDAGLFTVCHTADGDFDGFSGCTGDCDDANAAVHPGVPDSACDGIDEDCDGTADGGFAPAATSCGAGACAASGVTSCVAGVFHDSCAPGAPSPEACNGIDDDCNGVADDVPVPAAVPGLWIIPPASSALLTWPDLPAASAYDVVRGSLSVLHGSGGSFTLATQSCLADNVPATSVGDDALPAPGGGFWYLVRGSNCGGPGTYDSGSPSQSAPRDAEIQGSSSACP